MLFIPALVLAVSQSQGVPTSVHPPALLDSRWIDGIGTVELSTPGGPQLTVKISNATGSTSTRVLDLDLANPGASVVEARSSSFIAKEGMAIGLAIQIGETTSYHSLLIHRLADVPGNARVNVPGRPDAPIHWWLTKPIFTSTGDRYRIVDVHNPESDSVEITFRRGYVDTRRGDPRLDEKIYVNTCPGADDPFIAGSLLDISATRASRPR